MNPPASLPARLWRRLADHRIRTPLLAFIITRLVIALAAYFSAPIIADSAVPPYHLRPDNILLDVFGSRWDTAFYLGIAQDGYSLEGEPFSNVAFFPLLPLVMRLLAVFTGDELTAGLLAANLALLGAALLFYHYVLDEWGQPVAERAVWYLLIFPASFFGSAIYTESLFLLLAVGSLYLARKGFWESSGMLGILAALTRFVGLIVTPALLAEWLAQRRSRPEGQRPGWGALICCALPPLGTLAYMAYLGWRFGDPLAFLHASAAWARSPASPFTALPGLLALAPVGWMATLATGALPLDNWLDLFFVIVFIALGVVLLAQRRWSEAVFVLLGALLPLSSGLLMSQRRYMWVLFPAFSLLARWGGRSPWLDRAIIAVSIALLGLFTALFANWYWVG